METEREIGAPKAESVPRSLKATLYLIYASLLIGLVKGWLESDFIDAKSIASGVVAIFTIAFLGYMISKGKNWARITLLVLFMLGILLYPFALMEEFKLSSWIGALSLIQTAAQVIVVVMLFTGSVNQYFKVKR